MWCHAGNAVVVLSTSNCTSVLRYSWLYCTCKATGPFAWSICSGYATQESRIHLKSWTWPPSHKKNCLPRYDARKKTCCCSPVFVCACLFSCLGGGGGVYLQFLFLYLIYNGTRFSWEKKLWCFSLGWCYSLCRILASGVSQRTSVDGSNHLRARCFKGAPEHSDNSCAWSLQPSSTSC